MDWVVWYIDGKEIARKPNLYWHLPMHVTLSLGLRYPFEAYENGNRVAVPEKTTQEGFPTTMSVDYVRIWRNSELASASPSATKVTRGKEQASTDMTQDQLIAMEKPKWIKNGWPWDQAKVESNFVEMDTNKDGLASGNERQLWYAKKKAMQK
jgi:hypothetical protein